MTATRLKTGRGDHNIMQVTVGSPTKDGSGSSATGQYIEAGSYCKIVTDDAGGLKFANITDSRSTPTDGDNGYLVEAIIFNFSVDSMTDKWSKSITYAEVMTDVVPTVELEDGYGLDSSRGMNIDYFDAGAITNDTYGLLIIPHAMEILEVQAHIETEATVGTIQVTIGGDNCLNPALAPDSTLATATLVTSDSKIGSAGEVLALVVAGVWTNSKDLTVRIDYRYL